MADPLSITAGIVGLTGFALKASVILYTTVRNLHSQDKKARALRDELGDLTTVLELLLETASNHPEVDFGALRLPVERCGKACEEYKTLVDECNKHSTGSRPSLRNWIKQKYMQGDIEDFKDMLAVYKSTINIALANANLRIAVITPNVLADYKAMIRDTTADLQAHLNSLETRVESLSNQDASSRPPSEDPAWQAMVEEMTITQQGLSMCAQLSGQIEQLESTSTEHPQFSNRPSAHKHIKAGIGATKGPLQVLMSRLQSHEDELKRQMDTMKSESSSSPTASSMAATTEFARLQANTDSIHQCLKLVAAAADETVVVERRSHFEEVTVTDDAYGITVSTVGDLLTLRKVNIKDRGRFVAGQLDSQSYQVTINDLTNLDLSTAKSVKGIAQEISRKSSNSEEEDKDSGKLERHHRLGPGRTLSGQLT